MKPAANMEIKRKISNKPSITGSDVPITTKWNNEPMIRNHSIRAAVREILALNQRWDLVRVNAVGTPSTGKTELAKVAGHLVHELATKPYTIKILKRKELLNFDQTIKRLTPTNHFLVIDDMSFLGASAGHSKLLQVQKDSTEIRHLEGGIDVKIILWFNFHYFKSVPPYLRQADYYFSTTIGQSETKNALEIMNNNLQAIQNFRTIYKQAVTHPTGNYEFLLGKKGQKFVYHYREPFAPVLFFNGISSRIVVFPSRKWLAPLCPNCDTAIMDESNFEMNIDEFELDFARFGPDIVKEALKVSLFNIGVETYKKRVIQCIRALSRYFESHPINPEQLALAYNLLPKRTRLDRPEDFKKK